MKRVSLGDIAEFINGAAFKPEDWEENGLRIIRIQNLNDSSKPYNRTTRQVGEKYLVPTGTLLVSWSASLGVFEWNDLETAVLNQHIFKVLPDQSLVSQDYLRHMLENALTDMARHHRGSTMVHVNRKDFLGTTIPLPPLEEQKRIAGILDQADALRRLRTRALDKLNTLGQAIFHEMFGDVVSNSKGLNKARIGDHCERVSVGVVIKPASYYQEMGVPAVRGTNIKPTGIDLSEVVYFSEEDNSGALKKSRIYAGDVLVVRTGRPGLAAVVPEELDGANCIDVLITTTKTKTLLPEFLRDFLNSADGRSLVLSGSVGQVQQHFNVKSLANAEIPLPSLADQGLYLERTLQLEKHRSEVERHLNMLNCNFASLQHRAFRGEL